LNRIETPATLLAAAADGCAKTSADVQNFARLAIARASTWRPRRHFHLHLGRASNDRAGASKDRVTCPNPYQILTALFSREQCYSERPAKAFSPGGAQ
jgi:hypothetical protein